MRKGEESHEEKGGKFSEGRDVTDALANNTGSVMVQSSYWSGRNRFIGQTSVGRENRKGILLHLSKSRSRWGDSMHLASTPY